jgi:hypothetical protein
MSFEEDFIARLHDTAQSYRTDLTPLVASALQDGRRRLRRRRAGLVGGVAAVALIGVGAALLPVPVPGGAGTVTGPAATTSSTRATPLPTGDASATGRPPAVTTGVLPAPGPAVGTQQLISTLESLLPTGSATEPQGRGTDGPGVPDAPDAPFATVVFDDGHGASAITFSATHATLPLIPSDTAMACDPSISIAQVTCTAKELPGGYRFQLDQLLYLPAAQGLREWQGYLTAPDGTELELDETNAAQEQMSAKSHAGVRPTRADPPLTGDQIAALLSSASWDAVRAAQGEWYAPGSELNYPDPPVSGILGTLNSLLPPGVTHSGESYNAGARASTSVELSDGQGQGLLQVTVENWAIDLSANDRWIDSATVFGGAAVLPDGDQLALSELTLPAAEGGGVERTADLLRPDGLRIILQESSSLLGGGPGDGHSEGSSARPALVLSLSQLQDLVLSPKWHN